MSVNPYRMFSPLYGLDAVSKYDGQIIGTLPPHLFAVGASAYHRMLAKDGEKQVRARAFRAAALPAPIMPFHTFLCYRVTRVIWDYVLSTFIWKCRQVSQLIRQFCHLSTAELVR